ncbi:MAG TPA: efflux transporter outer membrane subunit [Vicinamibacterales bacterium]|nr:efflux transporter outer membrane subunit [Vicinamibacterales bacterium]
MEGIANRLVRTAALVLVVVLSPACTLGPDYKRPVVTTPAAVRGADPHAGTESLADLEWFELFQDPTLTRLVTAALEQNFDVRMAAERVLQARAAFGITRAGQFPGVDASAAVVGTRISQTGANRAIPPGVDPDVAYTQAGFSFGWELDVWGRLRRLSESARAQFFATEEARQGVVTTLIADVTETYLALRALDLELSIARRTRDVATDSLRLTEARRERGVATALDVRQSEQLLHIASAQIAGIERDLAQTENALSLLLGRMPGDIPRGLELEAFKAPPSVPAGLPSALLERRPDIRQAEQELIAANAQIGVAKAEYFPRISLTGFLGVQSRALSDLLSGPARMWTASADATVPIFNAGRTRANVRLAEAVQRELVVNYQKTIHTAFREVADSLAGYRKTSEQRAEQERLVEALRASAQLSAQRYEGGVDNYLQVLDARRNLFQGELDLARLRQQELASLVRLYRALGGGWDVGEERNSWQNG